MEYKVLAVMSQNDIEVGDSVEWTIDNGLYTKECSGKVLDKDLEKFGYNDVIQVVVTNSEGTTRGNSGREVYVRPKDLE